MTSRDLTTHNNKQIRLLELPKRCSLTHNRSRAQGAAAQRVTGAAERKMARLMLSMAAASCVGAGAFLLPSVQPTTDLAPRTSTKRIISAESGPTQGHSDFSMTRVQAMPSTQLYDLLGVKPEASQEEIRRIALPILVSLVKPRPFVWIRSDELFTIALGKRPNCTDGIGLALCTFASSWVLFEGPLTALSRTPESRRLSLGLANAHMIQKPETEDFLPPCQTCPEQLQQLGDFLGGGSLQVVGPGVALCAFWKWVWGLGALRGWEKALQAEGDDSLPRLQHLDGRTITTRPDKVLKPGSQHVLVGEGMPKVNSQVAQERGNLHLHFEVVLFLIREGSFYVFGDKGEYMLRVLCSAKELITNLQKYLDRTHRVQESLVLGGLLAAAACRRQARQQLTRVDDVPSGWRPKISIGMARRYNEALSKQLEKTFFVRHSNVLDGSGVLKLKDPTRSEQVLQRAVGQHLVPPDEREQIVPTKLAIGIKATVEKGEEGGKSWTPSHAA
eukprot:Skav218814  [mRNA]  locus=scaffold1140:466462:482769:- [translate_table: standard]